MVHAPDARLTRAQSNTHTHTHTHTHAHTHLHKHANLQVGGQNVFDDEEAESFEFGHIKVKKKVVFVIGEEKRPGRGDMMILQNRSIIVQNSLI